MIHQSARSFEARRVTDQRIRDMPMAIDKIRGTNLGDWIGGLFVVAVFAGLVML